MTATRRLREDLEEVNSHYQELIAFSKEALKRKRQTQSMYAELKQTIQDLAKKNRELAKELKSWKLIIESKKEDSSFRRDSSFSRGC